MIGYPLTPEIPGFQWREIHDVQCPEHVNIEMEIVIVTRGELKMTIGGTLYTLNAGDAVYVMPFESHDFVTEETSDCIVILAQDGFYRHFSETVSKNLPSDRRFRVGEGLIAHLLPHLCDPLSSALAFAVLSPLFYEIKRQCSFSDKKIFDNNFLQILAYINDNYTNDLTEQEIADSVGLHPFSVSRIFSDKAGMNLRTYVNLRRVHYAKERLASGEDNVSQIGLDAGFSTIRNFNRVFSGMVGMNPTAYRKTTKKENRK